MKKTNNDSNRSAYNHREEYLSPTRFPKKEFELIYREKEHLPSSEAYESIIFMKSKKCSQKARSPEGKLGTKIKNKPSSNIHQQISKLEKQFQQQRSNRNKKDKQVLGAPTLKNTSLPSKKGPGCAQKQKAEGRSSKNLKGEYLSCQIEKKQRNVVSPSKHTKTKLSQLATASTQFNKTAQDNFKKESKTKDKKKNKESKDLINSIFPFSEPEEFIFLDDHFVGLAPKDASILEEKLLTSRENQPYYLCPSSLRGNHELEELRIESHQPQRIFEEFQEYEDSSRTSKKGSVSSARDQLVNNNLSIVQLYFISKVKIIQRWWKKIYHQGKAHPQPDLNPIKEQGPAAIEDIPSAVVFDVDSEKSIHFNEQIMDSPDFFNASPIKMMDEFPEMPGGQTGELLSITSREKAAQTQRETHNNILQKLLVGKKISADTFVQKKDLVEARYYKQLREIEDVKKILQTNASKAAEMEKKTIEDMNLIERGDLMVDPTLLDQIFGAEEVLLCQERDCLAQMPVLKDSDVVNREKSTGCHFASTDTPDNLYKKDQSQEEYKEDFEEYGEGEKSPISIEEDNSNETAHGEGMASNLKELYDEFKLREEVKAQVDKRAAIQMGIIVENVPAELKNQFVSIDTSLNSIHRFILAFFKYYIFYYKFDFLRLINMPFGFNVDSKLKFLQGYTEEQCPMEDEEGVIYGLESVIPEDLFQEFYEKVYDMESPEMSSAKKANFQFEKMHNKAIFDSFNQALNIFRPYFLIDGPPFPWTCSERSLTFYFIAEENIQEVFEKTQFKVLKMASTLCGIIVDKYAQPVPALEEHEDPESICEKYKKGVHPLVNETREDRMSKNSKSQMEEGSRQWGSLQEWQARNNIEVSEQIFNDVVNQFLLEFFLTKPDEVLSPQKGGSQSLSDLEVY